MRIKARVSGPRMPKQNEILKKTEGVENENGKRRVKTWRHGEECMKRRLIQKDQ